MMSQRISPNDGDQPIILSESRGEKHNLNQISNVKQTVKLSRDLSKSHSSVGRQIQEELEQDRIDSTGRFTLSNILARLFSPSTHWERTKRIDELVRHYSIFNSLSLRLICISNVVDSKGDRTTLRSAKYFQLVGLASTT